MSTVFVFAVFLQPKFCYMFKIQIFIFLQIDQILIKLGMSHELNIMSGFFFLMKIVILCNQMIVTISAV